jgi:hypothetical protein
MSKDWRIILHFALVGLAIAAGIYTYFAFEFFTLRTTNVDTTDLDTSVGEVSLILCPPSLLCLWYCGHDIVTGPAIPIWFAIGLSNAALYALIGAAYVGLRRNPDGAASG